MKNNMKIKKSFTLVELLVVVAIIAILAAIAIPAYVSYREEAKKKSMVSNARQCLVTITAYMAAYPGEPATSAVVPTECTIINPQSCSCTMYGYTATCSITVGSSVNCSVS